MKIDLGKIRTRSWQIIWNYKVLWIFGILTGFANSNGGSSSNSSSSDRDPSSFTGSTAFVEQISEFFQQYMLMLFVFPKKLKNVKFVSTLLLKTSFYVLVITIPTLLLWVIHDASMVNNTGIMRTIASDDFNNIIFRGDFKIILFFSLTAGFLLNFFGQISSLNGKRSS